VDRRAQRGRLASLAGLILAGACGPEPATASLTTPDAGRAADASRAPRPDAAARETAPPPDGATVDRAGEDVADARNAADAGDAAASADRPGDAGAGDAGGAALRCNGHQALCDRRFDQVVFPATHNAMSNAEDGWFGPNQPHRLRQQLDDGIRALLLDTHAWRGGAYLCHSACELGNRPLVDGLRDIADFLRDNAHEVIALLVEDGLSVAEMDKAFQASGLVDRIHVQQPGAAWPTLREMISSGRRLLVTAEHGRPPPTWYHHLWDLAWDTPYSFKSASEFSCRLNRGRRENALFLLNHWVENPLPSPFLSRQVNGRDVLLGRARQCQTESGKLPNFVAVNHYTTGDLLAVVRELNGL
jgi:hypothetical protein